MTTLASTPELQLPWETSLVEDRRFRKILRLSLLVFAIAAIAVPLLPLEELTREAEEAVPPQLARVILEKRELPPPAPPPPPRAVEKPPVKKEPQKAPSETKPKPQPDVQTAREVASVSGVLAFRDELMAMRDQVDLQALDQAQVHRGEASAARVERAMVTAGAAQDSGGIQTAALSRDTGGAALSGRETTKVASSIAGKPDKADSKRAPGTLTGRSDESIRRVMDRNKGAIFAIYNRALRKDPLLEGKVVFEMVIDASGVVSEITLLSSDLTDEQLTRKILARVSMINFESRSVATTRVNYSFDFLPYT